MKHEFNCLSFEFKALKEGGQRAIIVSGELEVGDEFHLSEVNANDKKTGEKLKFIITHIQKGGVYGLEEGCLMLSLKPYRWWM